MSNFKIDSTLQKWGCILLGPETAESADSDRLYEAENLDGEVQNEVNYTPPITITHTKILLAQIQHQVSTEKQGTRSLCRLPQYPGFKVRI